LRERRRRRQHRGRDRSKPSQLSGEHQVSSVSGALASRFLFAGPFKCQAGLVSFATIIALPSTHPCMDGLARGAVVRAPSDPVHR
jgi:hypothetical protein